MSAISADLIAAYLSTEYWVAASPPWCLRVGERSEMLLGIYREYGVSSAAFVSAFNPYSASKTGERENLSAQEGLLKEIESGGYRYVHGDGRDPSGVWPPEPSVMVFGITRPDASALGLRFLQNAVIWTGKDGFPELVLLR